MSRDMEQGLPALAVLQIPQAAQQRLPGPQGNVRGHAHRIHGVRHDVRERHGILSTRRLGLLLLVSVEVTGIIRRRRQAGRRPCWIEEPASRPTRHRVSCNARSERSLCINLAEAFRADPRPQSAPPGGEPLLSGGGPDGGRVRRRRRGVPGHPRRPRERAQGGEHDAPDGRRAVARAILRARRSRSSRRARRSGPGPPTP